MHNPFKPGDLKTFIHKVDDSDLVKFHVGKLHPVYSTYAITRDAEWVCRLFVLEMKDADEEGIGTMVKVVHHAPAKVGDDVEFEGTFVSLIKNEIISSFKAHCKGK